MSSAAVPAVAPKPPSPLQEGEQPKKADAALKAKTKRMIEMQLRFARKKQQRLLTPTYASTSDQNQCPTVQTVEEFSTPPAQIDPPLPPQELSVKGLYIQN